MADQEDIFRQQNQEPVSDLQRALRRITRSIVADAVVDWPVDKDLDIRIVLGARYLRLLIEKLVSKWFGIYKLEIQISVKLHFST